MTRTFTTHRMWCLFDEWGFSPLYSDSRPGPLNPQLFTIANYINLGVWRRW